MEGKDRSGGEKAISVKRKDAVPLRNFQQNILSENRNKVEA